MQQPSESLGKLTTFSTEVHVIRDGQESILFQGDALREGDVILNKSNQPTEFELPARGPEQGLTKMILPAGAQATLSTMTTAEGTPITMVASPQAADIELIVEGDGSAVAEVIDGSDGAMSGLVGAGLLAGGGSLLAGSAALVGGAALLAGGSSDDTPDDSLSSQNGNSTAAPPEQVNGIEGVIGEVADALEDTPLEPVGEALDPVQDAVGAISDTLDSVSANDPTGLTGVVAGLVGGDATSPSNDTSSGLVGIVDEVIDGIAQGTANTPAGAVTAPLADALDQPLTLLDTVLSTQAEALDVVASNDPTGVTALVQNLLGGAEALATDTATNILPDAGQTSGLQGALAEVSDVLATGPLAPVASADPSGLVGTIQTLLGSDGVETTESGLPGADIFDGLLASGGDIPILGGLLGGISTASGGGEAPLAGDLPLLGDLINGISSTADLSALDSSGTGLLTGSLA